jgi:hypothetical protein
MKKLIIVLILLSGVAVGQVQKAKLNGLKRQDLKDMLQIVSGGYIANDTLLTIPYEALQKSIRKELNTQKNTFTLADVPAEVVLKYLENKYYEVERFEEIRKKRNQFYRVLKSWQVADPSLGILDGGSLMNYQKPKIIIELSKGEQ